MQHEAGEGEEVQPRRHFGQALVVARQAAEARTPGEIALHLPAPRQQDEAVLGLGRLDHLEADALRRGVGGGLLPRVALVDVGQ
jgi:hypothetical protein